MPEETAEATTPEATDTETGVSDPLDVSAADFYQTTEEDAEAATPEPTGEDGDDLEDEEADEAGETETDPEDAEFEDGDEEDIAAPRLRESIEAVLREHNPELISEWQNQWKGIEKKDAQFKEREQKIAEFDADIEGLYESPETAKLALDVFLPDLAKHHKTTVEALLGFKAAPTPTEDATDYNAFLSDDANLSEEGIALKRKHEADLAALRKEFEPVKAETEALKQRRAEDAARAETQDYVERVAPRTIKGIEKLYPGFTVTKQMITEAITALPAFKDKPLEAVEMHQTRAIAAHMGRLAEQRSGKGRELVPNREAKGKNLPTDPLDWKAADVYNA